MKKALFIAILFFSPALLLAQNLQISPRQIDCPPVDPTIKEIKPTVARQDRERGRELGRQAIVTVAACAEANRHAVAMAWAKAWQSPQDSKQP